jgi:cytochrome b
MNESIARDAETGGIATVRVWDPFVRVFHWTLVAAYFVAFFTEEDTITVHTWAGYVVGTLLVLRILWGFVGTKHARFSDFAYGPIAALRYFLALLTFRAKRHIGHSPAGAAMVYALLVSLLLAVATGLLAFGEERKGPLAPLFAENAAAVAFVVPPAHAEDNDRGSARPERRGRKHRFWRGIHELFANLTLFLVILHIGGVLLASVVHRENLARAMITGRKRP